MLSAWDVYPLSRVFWAGTYGTHVHTREWKETERRIELVLTVNLTSARMRMCIDTWTKIVHALNHGSSPPRIYFFLNLFGFFVLGIPASCESSSLSRSSSLPRFP